MNALLEAAHPAHLLLPLFLHFGLVVALYAALTFARLAAVARGQATHGDFARAGGDPEASARIQRNLANQFEAPLFAWAGALVLILDASVLTIDVAAAWLFFAGRVLHTLVQTLTDDVPLRGRVFVINFLGVCLLMGHAALNLALGLWPALEGARP
ncbi:MAG TPA: MAPEG family protein [Caulobacteraceae bacterium]|nr:MAPEG family protein [Caulobacteraceae bacterium]